MNNIPSYGSSSPINPATITNPELDQSGEVKSFSPHSSNDISHIVREYEPFESINQSPNAPSVTHAKRLISSDTPLLDCWDIQQSPINAKKQKSADCEVISHLLCSTTTATDTDSSQTEPTEAPQSGSSHFLMEIPLEQQISLTEEGYTKNFKHLLENNNMSEVLGIIANLDASIEERDKILADYIKNKRIPLRKLYSSIKNKKNHNRELYSSEKHILRLSKHLEFIDLRQLSARALGQAIIQKSTKSYELIIDDNAMIENLSELSNCKSLDCSNCHYLTTLPKLPNCTSLDCASCFRLIALPELPNCTTLNCSICNKLTTLPELPNCTSLNCSHCNALTTLPELPNCTSFNCAHCINLTTLPELPNCTSLNCSCCHRLTNLKELPNCTILDCSACFNLTTLLELPNCTILDCSGCFNLTTLPELPNCTILDCSKSENLRTLPELPSCETLNVAWCINLEDLPDLPNGCILNAGILNLPTRRFRDVLR